MYLQSDQFLSGYLKNFWLKKTYDDFRLIGVVAILLFNNSDRDLFADNGLFISIMSRILHKTV